MFSSSDCHLGFSEARTWFVSLARSRYESVLSLYTASQMTPREKTNTIKKKAKKPEESMYNEEHTFNGVRISDMIHSTLGALFETWSFDYVYLEAVVSIGKEEGIKGYWKGNLAQISLSWEVVRILPYSAVQQFAYESYKKLYAGKDGELSVSGRLAADASAGMTSTFAIIFQNLLTCFSRSSTP
ncbi:hypothetical protein L2E82_25784 [Cichorium intybus]|uniref:Uncharacterized protein n=1 Tax=Cichorium intybus TaxID=13427 RepID=A0ACB9E572_CICIN|nr:hypothetical protein L2E82_25784 [Cichorium intybus]